MSKIRLFLCFSMLCFFHVVAETEETEIQDHFKSSLISTQSLLSTTIDSVSTISGEWLNSEMDLIVNGPDPLVLTRFYLSNYTYSNRLGYNWEFNRPHDLTIKSSKKHGHKQVYAQYQHPSGSISVHRNDDPGERKIIPLKLHMTQGLINCRAWEVSAKTNLHNTMILLNQDRRHCTAITGSRHITYFKNSGKANPKMYLNHFEPVFERKANGNLILFKKDAIYSYNPAESVCYGWIKFNRINKELLEISSSDGKKAAYSFVCYEEPGYDSPPEAAPYHRDPVAYRYYLSQVDFSHKPKIEYAYTVDKPTEPVIHPPNPVLKSKKWPEGRFEGVEYYKVGTNKLDGLDSIKLYAKDFRVNRVKYKKAPVGTDGTSVITHRFVYHNKSLFNKPDYLHGEQYRTDVFDAYLRKSTYWYNEERRPTLVRLFDKMGQPYSSEGYVWDEKYVQNQLYDRLFNPDEEEQTLRTILPQTEASVVTHFKKCLKEPFQVSGGKGNLKGKYLMDASEAIIHAQYFDYDHKGNIKEERFYGNLTGLSQQPIQLDINGLPLNNGAECYKKNYHYSHNGYNLLLSENEDNGKGILYSYYPHSDLVAAKYITEEGRIRFRQFFEYDENTTLIKLIKDNGSAKEEHDLTSVTERHITEYVPRRKEPIGLPASIVEKYLDLGTGQERLLKKVDCKYDMQGHLIRQKHFDADNQFRYALNWQYNGHGKVIYESNAIGQEIHRKYDQNDNLIFEQGPGTEFYTEHSYDFVNRLIGSKEVHTNGQVFTTSYQYDYLGNKIAEYNRLGRKTSYDYDEFNRLIKIEYPRISNEMDEVIRPFIQTVYDEANRPIKKIDACGYETCLTYNARGEPISIIHPDGSVEKFEYQLDGALIKSIAPNGTQTVYDRDFLGRILVKQLISKEGVLLSRESFEYLGHRLISHTDSEGCMTTWTYDGAGRLISETRGSACKTYAYDSLNRVAQLIQWYGCESNEKAVHIFIYDNLNRLIEERLEDGSGNILQKNGFEYDIWGNTSCRIRNTEVGESRISIEYNSDKKPILITDAEGNSTHIHYRYDQRNELGQRVLSSITTDPLGRITYQIYDALGRIAKVIKKDSFGILLAQQEIIYDVMGRQCKTIDSVIVDGEVQREYINARHYHINGQEDTLIEAQGTPDQRITYIHYNSFGEKEKVIKPDGVCIQYTYDALGRVSQVASSDGTIDYRYAYNSAHQILYASDENTQTKTSYEYNLQGHLKQEILGNGLELKFDYDRMDRLTEIQFPDRTSVRYLYNAAYLKSVRRLKEGEYYHEYHQHDQSGRLIEAEMIGKAGSLHYQQDLLGRTTHINTPQWIQNTPKGSFDPVGRLLSTMVKDALGEITHHYEYDDLDHLQSEQGHFTHTYQTDSIHNRLQKNHHRYHIDHHNQVTKQADCSYHYDLNGNLIRKKQADKVTDFAYDAYNRLIKVSSSDSETGYQYDPFGRRLRKTDNGKTTLYVYQGQNEIGCIHDQKITELRILGTGVDAEIGAAIAIELEDKVYAPIHDRQGHVVALIDSQTGLTAESYRYSAFGEEAIFDNQGKKVEETQIGNPWRFASKRVDPETGWIYFGKRYYDPEIGRWITPDPLSFTDGPNLYAYLHHNPLTAYDAYGLVGEAYADSCAAAQMAHHYALPDAIADGSSNREDSSLMSVCGQGIGSLSMGVCRGSIHPVDTMWKHSGYVVTLSCNIWDHGFSSNAIDNANCKECFVKGCEITGEVGGIALSVFLIASSSATEVVYGCQAVGRTALSNLARTFNRPAKLASEIEKRYVVTETVTTGVGQGARITSNSIQEKVKTTADFIWSEIRLGENRALKGWVDLRTTLNRIKNGEIYSHRNDGTVFKNREGLLPKHSEGYYREFVQPTPSIQHAGPQRIITGEKGELFYTPDHYKTFIPLN